MVVRWTGVASSCDFGRLGSMATHSTIPWIPESREPNSPRINPLTSLNDPFGAYRRRVAAVQWVERDELAPWVRRGSRRSVGTNDLQALEP